MPPTTANKRFCCQGRDTNRRERLSRVVGAFLLIVLAPSFLWIAIASGWVSFMQHRVAFACPVLFAVIIAVSVTAAIAPRGHPPED